MFDDFWAVYPRRVGKGQAQKSWDRAVNKLKIMPSVIIGGAKRYAAEKKGSDQQYIAHPSTWLNGQRWLDEAGAAEPEEPTFAPDAGKVAVLQANKRARELRDQLVNRTRETQWPRVTEAARRLGCTPGDLWSCLTPGFDGILYRAWTVTVDHVFHQQPPVTVLPIEKEHWLSARDRWVSRANISREKITPVFTSAEYSEINARPPATEREEDAEHAF